MSMVDVKAVHIENGQMIKLLDASLNRVGQEVIQEYWNNDDASVAKGKVVLEIEIAKHPDYEDQYHLGYQIKKSFPVLKGKPSLADGSSGSLQANHRGTDGKNPNQESFLNEPTLEGNDEQS
jgi:hypothetical protein